MRTEFQERKAERGNEGRNGGKRVYHTLDMPSAGKVSRKKRKARKNPSAPSVVRKMRKRKGMRRISPQTHPQAGKCQKCTIFDRNMQESVIRGFLAAERGEYAADIPFPLRKPLSAPRARFFHKKGENPPQFSRPSVCVKKYSTFRAM